MRDGEELITDNTILVDCSTNGLTSKPAIPVFTADKLTLQSTLYLAQTSSAAHIAWIETRDWSQDKKNLFSIPIPHPNLTKPDLANSMIL